MRASNSYVVMGALDLKALCEKAIAKACDERDKALRRLVEEEMSYRNRWRRFFRMRPVDEARVRDDLMHSSDDMRWWYTEGVGERVEHVALQLLGACEVASEVHVGIGDLDLVRSWA